MMSENVKEQKENLETELESLQSELSTLEQEWERMDFETMHDFQMLFNSIVERSISKDRISEIQEELGRIDSEGLE